MINDLVFLLTFITALGCGVVAGIFFAFSSFIMRALGRIAPEQGIAAMQAINVTVLNPLFFLVFFGAALGCLVLVAGSFFMWHRPDTIFQFTGGLVYLIGTILVTIVCNVPRNDALAKVGPSSEEGTELWRRYLAGWTVWNHVRTIAALVAAVLLSLAL